MAVVIGYLARAIDLAAGRVGSASSRPSTIEIAANYTRGWVLFGIPSPRLARFEWRFLPMRAVITAETAEIPKRIRPIQRRGELEVRFTNNFAEIIEASRAGRSGWLTSEAVLAYRELHDLGFVSSVGTYRDGQLVGGLWGVSIGPTFGIMSMFHTENHAGSLALAALVEKVRSGDEWTMIDCGGVLKKHFEWYGAHVISATDFSHLVWAGVAHTQAVSERSAEAPTPRT